MPLTLCCTHSEVSLCVWWRILSQCIKFCQNFVEDFVKVLYLRTRFCVCWRLSRGVFIQFRGFCAPGFLIWYGVGNGRSFSPLWSSCYTLRCFFIIFIIIFRGGHHLSLGIKPGLSCWSPRLILSSFSLALSTFCFLEVNHFIHSVVNVWWVLDVFHMESSCLITESIKEPPEQIFSSSTKIPGSVRFIIEPFELCCITLDWLANSLVPVAEECSISFTCFYHSKSSI